jgi:hypothetical protein
MCCRKLLYMGTASRSRTASPQSHYPTCMFNLGPWYLIGRVKINRNEPTTSDRIPSQEGLYLGWTSIGWARHKWLLMLTCLDLGWISSWSTVARMIEKSCWMGAVDWKYCARGSRRSAALDSPRPELDMILAFEYHWAE